MVTKVTSSAGVPGFRRSGGSAALALAGALLASTITATRADAAACKVTNERTQSQDADLQSAVTSAVAGDRLRVAGVCVGSTVVDRSLVLRGARRATSGGPILDGGHAGRVLEIGSGAVVRIDGLVIRRGKANGDLGGGILNHGSLTLKNVVVARNRADSGGGVYTTGPLILKGTTSIEHNKAVLDDGGGVYVDGASLTTKGSTALHDNVAGRGGGGLYGVSAELALGATTSVHDNRATGGGGVYADFWSTLVLGGSTSIAHNRAAENGGGVFDNSSVTMTESSSIRDNVAAAHGGGVFVGCNSELIGALGGGNVAHNHPGNKAAESGCP